MERLVGNDLGPDESWREYAEHSLTHDDLLPVQAGSGGNANPVVARSEVPGPDLCGPLALTEIPVALDPLFLGHPGSGRTCLTT